MGAYPTQPSPYAGTSLLAQRLDPLTLFLYNQPPPTSPPPTTTTLPPADPGYGAAAAAQPSMAQSYAQNLAAMGAVPPDAATTHQQYGMLRGLDQLMRGGLSGESLYPFLQSLMDQGVLRPGANGIGLDTSIPWGGPMAPKTQRLIDAYEGYQDWLNGGNAPVRWPAPQPPTGWTFDPSQPRILGTLPPGGAR